MAGGERRITRGIAIAGAVWLGLCFVLWNVIFDREVQRAEKQYVERQDLHEQARGPAVTIDEVMRPGVRRALKVASGWSGAVTAVGLVIIGYAGGRRLRDNRNRGTPGESPTHGRHHP